MTVRYEKFLPEVVPYVHDVAEVVAINAIRNACIEFCEKSLYWIYTPDPITAEIDVSEYDLESSLPADTIVSRVLDGWFDNLPMTATNEDELKRIFPMDWRSMQGRPSFYTLQQPCTLIIVPRPTALAGDGIKLILALRPTRDSLGVCDDIYERWLEVISFGARARLYDTPNQPYHDPNEAMKFRRMFVTGIAEAKADRNRGLGRNVPRARPPRLI